MTYEIIRSSRRTVGIQVKDGRVIVRAPHFALKSEIEEIVRTHRGWIEKQLLRDAAAKEAEETAVKFTERELKEIGREARKRIPERVSFYAERVGVRYGRISFRFQKTRWGSCSSKGNLSFNCLLVLAPPEVLDSVVVHELCHRKEMNHSARFYAEVLKVFPEYKKWNGWLKKHGKELLARLP